MSKLFVGLLSAAQMAALHEAGHVVTPPVQHAVAALMQQPIAQAVAGDIAALKDTSLSGAEKAAQVVAKTAPAVIELLSKGGISRTETEVLSIAKQLVQGVYDSVTPSSAASVAMDVLKLLA